MNKRVDYICFLLFTHTHLIVATTNIKKKYGSNAHLNLLYYFLDCTKKYLDKKSSTNQQLPSQQQHSVANK